MRVVQDHSLKTNGASWSPGNSEFTPAVEKCVVCGNHYCLRAQKILGEFLATTGDIRHSRYPVALRLLYDLPLQLCCWTQI